MNWKRLVGVWLALVLAFCVDRWLYVPDWQRKLSQVVGGMTVEQVRQIMGKPEDTPDERRTTTGEIERSWTFEDDLRLTFVFDNQGRLTYTEFAPNWCGVTPLMGKYVNKKDQGRGPP